MLRTTRRALPVPLIAVLVFSVISTGTADATSADESSPLASGVTVPNRSLTDTAAALYLNDSWSSAANIGFTLGTSTDQFISGDWDGDGVDGVAIRRGNSYYLTNTLGDGRADVAFAYGKSTDEVLVGDWDGDGVDTLMVRRGNLYYVQNSLTGGEASAVIGYGKANDLVYVGDWDGDGKDTLAVRRGNVFYVKNSMQSGEADRVFGYGRAADAVLTGDWNGDGKDTLAVRRGNVFHVKNSMQSGQADIQISYGRPTDEMLAGDWNGDGEDTVGVVRRTGEIPPVQAANNPQIYFDTVVDNEDGTATLTGWAFDSDSSDSIIVAVFTDGTRKLVYASLERSDVQTAYGLSSASVGFSTTVDVSSGTHSFCVVAVNEGSGSNSTPACKSAKTTIDPDVVFVAGNIISDAVMFNESSMSQAAIQTFLNDKGKSCVNGSVKCLKNYTATTQTMEAKYCATYKGASNESAASMIYKAATACGINPQVLIVMLQKEQGLVTASGAKLTAQIYNKALGFSCPDNSACDPQYSGLAVQLYYAASKLVQYGEEPNRFNYRVGQTAKVAYSPTASCGSASVTFTNRATAALYNYTPYQPNAAALDNMYGEGDNCSSYGNRNFWRYFIDWFGSSH